jgi:hypothetical protein
MVSGSTLVVRLGDSGTTQPPAHRFDELPGYAQQYPFCSLSFLVTEAITLQIFCNVPKLQRIPVIWKHILNA